MIVSPSSFVNGGGGKPDAGNTIDLVLHPMHGIMCFSFFADDTTVTWAVDRHFNLFCLIFSSLLRFANAFASASFSQWKGVIEL